MLSFAISMLATSAFAGHTATDLATARELYNAGAAALDGGDAKGAAEKFSAAWQLAPTPLIGVALARAQAKLGHVVEAREAVLAVRRLAVDANETAHSKEARAEANVIDTDMARRIAKLHVVANNAPVGATVLVDGSATSLASFAVDRPMNPGTHEVELHWAGASHAHVSVTLNEGERKEVVLEAPIETPPPQTPDVVQPPTVTPTPLAPIEPRPKAHMSPLVPVGATSLGVGLAFGAIFGALTLNDAPTVRDLCANKACPASAQGTLHDAQLFGALSTIGFAIAGVGVVVLVIGLVTSSPSKVHASAHGLVIAF